MSKKQNLFLLAKVKQQMKNGQQLSKPDSEQYEDQMDLH